MGANSKLIINFWWLREDGGLSLALTMTLIKHKLAYEWMVGLFINESEAFWKGK